MTIRLTTLAITGISCGSCAHHIDETLRAVPGVTSVIVDPKSQRAQILHEAATTTAALITATVDAGYEVTHVTDAPSWPWRHLDLPMVQMSCHPS